MKYLTKEQVQKAIDKVEAQGKLLRFRYSEGAYRCIVGWVLGDDFISTLPSKYQNRNIDSVYEDYLGTWEVPKALVDLQDMHDRAESLESFVKQAREYIDEVFN